MHLEGFASELHPFFLHFCANHFDAMLSGQIKWAFHQIHFFMLFWILSKCDLGSFVFYQSSLVTEDGVYGVFQERYCPTNEILSKPFLVFWINLKQINEILQMNCGYLTKTPICDKSVFK